MAKENVSEIGSGAEIFGNLKVKTPKISEHVEIFIEQIKTLRIATAMREYW